MREIGQESEQGLSLVTILFVVIILLGAVASAAVVANEIFGNTEPDFPEPENVRVEHTGKGVYLVTYTSNKNVSEVTVTLDGKDSGSLKLNRVGESAKVRLSKGDSFKVTLVRDGEKTTYTTRTQEANGAENSAISRAQSASTTIILDRFENESLYQYQGDVDKATVLPSEAYENNSSLVIRKNKTIYSTRGYAYYPRQGDTIIYHFRQNDEVVETTFEFRFAYKNKSNYYYIAHKDWGVNKLVIGKVVTGNRTVMKERRLYDWSDQMWGQVQIQWTYNGWIEVSGRNPKSGDILATVKVRDTTFKRGGFAFKSGHEPLFVDKIVIKR